MKSILTVLNEICKSSPLCADILGVGDSTSETRSMTLGELSFQFVVTRQNQDFSGQASDPWREGVLSGPQIFPRSETEL